MTSLAAGELRSGSRGWPLWLALIISLVINAFLVGTLVWWVGATRMQPAAERFREIGQELKLNDDQHDAFQQLVIEIRRNGRQLREHNGPLIEKIWAEQAKPQPDMAAINQLIDQSNENRKVFQKNMAAALARFLATLTPAQRGQFIELTKERTDQVARRLRHLVIP
jgi:Spy/CpxP family protein refolding chaperone